MDSSYISHFRDSTPSFFLPSYLIIYRVIVISAAKVQSGCDKNRHRKKKSMLLEPESEEHSYSPFVSLHLQVILISCY